MLEQGKNLETIRKFLGHSDITTTARYLHVDDNEVTIAASETLEELMSGEKGKEIQAARKTECRGSGERHILNMDTSSKELMSPDFLLKDNLLLHNADIIEQTIDLTKRKKKAQ